MEFKELIYKRRTIRRFKPDPISLEILRNLIDFARVAPMANNIQGLEFIIINSAEICEKIFPLIKFSSSLPENQRTPEVGRRPTAYIVVLVNTKIKKTYFEYDVGAAVENILLGAIHYGIGSCWMANINRKEIQKLCEIPEDYRITQVISLGYPDETSVMEHYKDSYKYWRDDDNLMHIPKRTLDDIIFKVF